MKFLPLFIENILQKSHRDLDEIINYNIDATT